MDDDRNWRLDKDGKEDKTSQEKDDKGVHRDRRGGPSISQDRFSDMPPRWQQGGAPTRGGGYDYGRKSASPGIMMDQQDKRRQQGEVQAALERAEQLHKEEEKRFEEKKRGDKNVKRRDRDYSESSSTAESANNDASLSGEQNYGRDSRTSKSGNQDNRDWNDQQSASSWGTDNSKSGSNRDFGRNYGPENNRRDGGYGGPGNYRDQYDHRGAGSYHDRRDRDPQQPVFSSSFKSKLPPRFQKQQQEMSRAAAASGGQAYRPAPGQQGSHPPSLFEPRYNQPPTSNRNRDDGSKFISLVLLQALNNTISNVAIYIVYII